MADLDALRRAGRAGGVHHVGERIAVDRGDARRLLRRHVTGNRREIDRDARHRRRQRIRRIARRHQHHGDAGIVEHEAQAFGGMMGIERQIGRARFEHREHGDHRRGRTLHRDRDHVARCDAGGIQPCGERGGMPSQIGITQGAVAIDHRRRIGMGIGDGEKASVHRVGARARHRGVVPFGKLSPQRLRIERIDVRERDRCVRRECGQRAPRAVAEQRKRLLRQWRRSVDLDAGLRRKIQSPARGGDGERDIGRRAGVGHRPCRGPRCDVAARRGALRGAPFREGLAMFDRGLHPARGIAFDQCDAARHDAGQARLGQQQRGAEQFGGRDAFARAQRDESVTQRIVERKLQAQPRTIATQVLRQHVEQTRILRARLRLRRRAHRSVVDAVARHRRHAPAGAKRTPSAAQALPRSGRAMAWVNASKVGRRPTGGGVSPARRISACVRCSSESRRVASV